MIVRQAVGGDAARCAAVLNAVIAEGRYTLFDTPFSEAQQRAFIASRGPRSALYVAEVDTDIVGMQSVDLHSTWASSLAHVATLGTWLLPDARGQGVGRALAEESIPFARTQGFSKVVVQVLACNHRALRFYRGLGFSDIGIARRHVRLGEVLHDEVFLEMFLEPSDRAPT